MTGHAIELDADDAARLGLISDEHGVGLDEALGTALRLYLAMPRQVRNLLASDRPEDVEAIARLQWEIERVASDVARRIGAREAGPGATPR